MIYEFICDKCGEEKEIEKGMNDLMPKVFCDVCNIEMHRDYASEQKDKALHIPENMRATFQTNVKSDYRYDKSPSGKKHFW